MNLKVPWIISRRRKIIAIFLDFLVTIFFYNFFFLKETNSYPNNLVSISLAFFWVILSYILGRYLDNYKSGYDRIYKSIIKIIFLIILCNIVYLSINLTIPLLFHYGDSFYQYFSSELSNIFIRISIHIGVTSLILQHTFSKLTKRIIDKKETWLFIGSNKRLYKLQKEIELKKSNFNIEKFSKFEENKYENFRNLCGIIFEDLKLINQDDIKKILKYKDIKIISLLNWFEKNFQRIPSDLIPNRYEFKIGLKSLEKNYQLRIKRAGDIIASLIIIFFTLPIVLIISLLIFLEDKGPVFYSQNRTGMNGEKIKIFKFRSMRIDAENEGIQWSNSNDIRITKVGKLIRATRFDELPQLLCVINGSMSLIGPRPERPEIEQKLLSQIPFYHYRYTFKPGLSGWAQVNFPYGASVADTKKKLSFDLYYISHFSILFDFLILIKTIKLVFNAKGYKPIK